MSKDTRDTLKSRTVLVVTVSRIFQRIVDSKKLSKRSKASKRKILCRGVT